MLVSVAPYLVSLSTALAFTTSRPSVVASLVARAPMSPSMGIFDEFSKAFNKDAYSPSQGPSNGFTNFCTSCGEPVGDWKFCANCGAQLRPEAYSSEPNDSTPGFYDQSQQHQQQRQKQPYDSRPLSRRQQQPYQLDSSEPPITYDSRDAYGSSDSYGPSRSDAYTPSDSFGQRHPYAPDPYSSDPYASDPYRSDPYVPDAYGPDTYGPDALERSPLAPPSARRPPDYAYGRGGALNGLGVPLPDSFFGAPFLSGFGSLANMVEEGRSDTNNLLQAAEDACRADARVTELLGDDISLGGIFSSSSASLNGQKRIQLQCSISGVGTAALRGESRGGELQLVSLQVSAAGRVIDVPVEDRDGRRGARIDRRGSDGLARRGGGIDEEEVIDVDAW